MSLLTAGHIHLKFITEAISARTLLGYLIGFRKSYPEIRFSLTADNAAGIEADLIADRLQFGVLSAVQNVDFLQTIVAGSTRMLAVAAPRYLERRQAGGDSLKNPSSILTADLIDIAPELPLLKLWLGRAPAPETQPSLVLPDESCALAAAAMGGGVAFAPEALARPRIARGELVELCTPPDNAPLPLLFTYRKKNSRQLIENVFIEYLMEQRDA